MKPDIPFRECARCEYIEDCPHPTVNDVGSPIPPRECSKSEDIKLTRRTQPQRQ